MPLCELVKESLGIIRERWPAWGAPGCAIHLRDPQGAVRGVRSRVGGGGSLAGGGSWNGWSDPRSKIPRLRTIRPRWWRRCKATSCLILPVINKSFNLWLALNGHLSMFKILEKGGPRRQATRRAWRAFRSTSAAAPNSSSSAGRTHGPSRAACPSPEEFGRATTTVRGKKGRSGSAFSAPNVPEKPCASPGVKLATRDRNQLVFFRRGVRSEPRRHPQPANGDRPVRQPMRPGWRVARDHP